MWRLFSEHAVTVLFLLVSCNPTGYVSCTMILPIERAWRDALAHSHRETQKKTTRCHHEGCPCEMPVSDHERRECVVCHDTYCTVHFPSDKFEDRKCYQCRFNRPKHAYVACVNPGPFTIFDERRGRHQCKELTLEVDGCIKCAYCCRQHGFLHEYGDQIPPDQRKMVESASSELDTCSVCHGEAPQHSRGHLERLDTDQGDSRCIASERSSPYTQWVMMPFCSPFCRHVMEAARYHIATEMYWIKHNYVPTPQETFEALQNAARMHQFQYEPPYGRLPLPFWRYVEECVMNECTVDIED
jgi:hypothetical protein